MAAGIKSSDTQLPDWYELARSSAEAAGGVSSATAVFDRRALDLELSRSSLPAAYFCEEHGRSGNEDGAGANNAVTPIFAVVDGHGGRRTAAFASVAAPLAAAHHLAPLGARSVAPGLSQASRRVVATCRRIKGGVKISVKIGGQGECDTWALRGRVLSPDGKELTTRLEIGGCRVAPEIVIDKLGPGRQLRLDVMLNDPSAPPLACLSTCVRYTLTRI
jgi:hypothetical protein